MLIHSLRSVRIFAFAAAILTLTTFDHASARQLANICGLPRCRLAQAAAASDAQTPGYTGATPQSQADVVRATLGNGLKVVLIPNKLAPVAISIMMYGVGADDDTMPGVAHATEHMLFRGTRNVSAGQFADIAARMGAQYDALTSNEYTLYYFKLPAAYVPVALHLEADRMTGALIRQQDWTSERGAIEQEVRGQESIPGYRVGVKLRQTFFAGTPFANSTAGTVESFEKMRSDDILKFYSVWYHPNNATVIVAGNINPQHTLADIHSLFDAIPAVALPPRPAISVTPLSNKIIRDTLDFPIGFSALEFRLPGANDPDYAASQVLSEVFKSSRGALTDLSSQGKVLTVFSFSSAYPELGALFVAAIPQLGGTPESAQTLVEQVLDQYRKDGLPSDLIAAAKNRLLAEAAYSEASISGLGLSWAEAVAQRRDSPDDIFGQIARVSDADVNRVLRTYIVPERELSVIIQPKPSASVPTFASNSGMEDVSYTPSGQELLPDWASMALKASLSPPQADTNIVNHHFSNGLRLIIRRETTSPTVVVSGVIRNAPNLYEPKGKDGVNLVLEQLMSWGTTTLDRKAYQTQLDDIAATVSLNTNFELRVRSADFERGMQLLSDGLLHPGLPATGFAVAKRQVQQSVAVANQLPKEKADLEQRLALYPPGDPRRRDVTETTVGNVTLDDVSRWYKFAYRPDVTAMAIVGDIDPDRAIAATEKYFASWTASGHAPTFLYPALPDRNKGKSKPLSITVRSKTNSQSEVTLKEVFRLRRSDDDYVPLLLANTMLSGEGTGSLLFQNLRSHYGYIYNVNSSFDVTQDNAEITISFASAPQNVTRAQAAAMAVLRRLQSQPLPSVELQRAKALLLAQRVLPLDSYEGVAEDMLAGFKDGYYNDGSNRWFWDALVRITPAQIEHAMRRVAVDRFVRVVIAP